MSKKDRIKELETELRILDNMLYVRKANGAGLHARHNQMLLRYFEIVKELEELSLKWKVKRFLRRFEK